MWWVWWRGRERGRELCCRVMVERLSTFDVEVGRHAERGS
jgi:hypothetical protein